jgi:hypothetical protein
MMYLFFYLNLCLIYYMLYRLSVTVNELFDIVSYLERLSDKEK